MRKFTSIIALLLAFAMSASAQNDFAGAGLAPNNAYTIGGQRGHWYADAANFKSEKDAGLTFDATNENFQFAFVPDPEDASKVYLYSVGQKKFINKDRSLVTAAPDQIYVFNTGDADYPLFFSFTSDKSNYNVNLGGSQQMLVDTWSAYDAGNKNKAELASGTYSLAEAQAMLSSAIEVTYQVSFNGAVIKSMTVMQQSGSAAQLPAAFANDYLTFGEPSVATVSATDNLVTYQATSTLPFTLSEDYATATWYTLNLRNNSSKYVVNEGAGGCVLTTMNKFEKGLWAFMGNPYAIKVINMAAGAGQVLRGDNPPAMKAPQGTNADAWVIAKNNYGFTLHLGGTTYYLHDLAGSFSYWNTTAAATDQGSAFVAQEPVYSIEDAAAYAAGTKWGDIADTPERQAAYDAFVANPTLETLNALIAACQFIGSDGYVNIANTSAVGAGNSIGLNSDYTKVHGQATNTADINQLWTVTSVEKGKVRLYNANTKKYLGNIAVGGANTTPLSDTPVDWAITWTDDNFTLANGGFNLNYEGGAGNEGNLNGWWGNDTYAATVVKDIPEALHSIAAASGAKSYATAYLPFNATVSGAKAYLTSFNATGDALTLQETSVIPAETGVVLISDENAAEAMLTITDEEAATGTSVLSGTLLPMEWNSDYLSLGVSNNVAGFYKWSGTTLGANKAYLVNNSGAKGFAFDEGSVTAIEKAVTDIRQAESPVYNLAGQRVGKAEKGVYIMNGKKVVVK